MTSLAHFLVNYGFPPQYMWAIPIALIILGVVFSFFSEYSWKTGVGLIGAVAGFLIVNKFIAPILVAHAIVPDWWAYVIVMGILSVYIYRKVKIGIVLTVAGVGLYAAYIQTFVALPIVAIAGLSLPVGVIAVGVIAGVLAYAFYGKISMLIGATLGTLMVYFGMSMYVLPLYAAVIAGIILVVGLLRQTRSKAHFRKVKK